jgi:hypothetical protein
VLAASLFLSEPQARWQLLALSGHSRHRNILSAIGIRTDIDQPLLALFSRSLNLVVDDLSPFPEGFGRG